ncbi:HERV-K_6q14.1 provirus ancestral Gag-Pol polyprotein-like isoform X2 [Leptotrombidium deliense]|uniref:human endogenous retrovirus K endopeptidase n=1 Tax=Leptotrombidium deliense TaxID=299467 RepID=A0A443RWP5_9ACAR|nr:HERV-K_6q14.1 provirus ancestral Gag-Pol polyprotein-like isoform X2 [Leptotrombidium deliense]
MRSTDLQDYALVVNWGGIGQVTVDQQKITEAACCRQKTCQRAHALGATNIQGNADSSQDFLSAATPRRYTSGSAGLDLSATARAVLTPDMGVQVIPADMSGPLPHGMVGLLLGRSSSALKGLHIIPGVIDPDFTGPVKILAFAPRGIISISPGDRIAQLLILPSRHGDYPSMTRERGNAGLGSTGSSFSMLAMDLKSRPMTKLSIEGREFAGLLDTGADLSIIKTDDWPKEWPIQQSDQTLRGLGIAASPNRSAAILKWRDEEGHQGSFQPYILDHLPVNLWGRDVMTGMKLKLTSDVPFSSPAANHIMLAQGHVWGMGLGKDQQGTASPITAQGQTDRKGLGF